VRTLSPELREALKGLDLLSRAVLVRRNGLDGRHARTFTEISEELGLSPSQARVKYEAAVLRLRRVHRIQ